MENSNFKKVAASLLATSVILGGSVVPVFAANSEPVNDFAVGSGYVQPRDIVLAESSYYGESTYFAVGCDPKDGRTLNFWIYNKGPNTVSISIWGNNSREFPPYTQGNISFPVNSMDVYRCQVNAVTGNTVNIDYKIAQRA